MQKRGMIDLDEYSKIFKALSDPFRLKIIMTLPKTNNCEDMYNVTELIEELGGSQPNMSHHLGILKNAGLLKFEKVCNSTYFYVDQPKLDAILKSFREAVFGSVCS